MVDCLAPPRRRRRAGPPAADGAGRGDGRCACGRGPIELDARLSGTTARFVAAGGRRSVTAATGLDGGAPLRDAPDGDAASTRCARSARGVERRASWGHLPSRDGRRPPGRRGGPPGRRLEPVRRPACCWRRRPCPTALRLELTTPLVSRPYLDHHRGRDARRSAPTSRPRATRSSPSRPAATAATDYAIEPDASAASYFFAAAAITRRPGARCPGLGPASLPGRPGASSTCWRAWVPGRSGPTSTTVVGDRRRCTASTSTWPTSPTRRRPWPRWPRSPIADPRHAASGSSAARRATASAAVVRRAAAARRRRRRRRTTASGRAPGPLPPGAASSTYDDHRMAMSFALLGLRVPASRSRIPACVAKTFPDYWSALGTLRRPASLTLPWRCGP